MTRATTLLATLLGTGAVLALATSATAQRQRAFGGPEVGATVPDVAGYDADGNKLELTSLRGKHAVIVFGCLT